MDQCHEAIDIKGTATEVRYAMEYPPFLPRKYIFNPGPFSSQLMLDDPGG